MMGCCRSCRRRVETARLGMKCKGPNSRILGLGGRVPDLLSKEAGLRGLARLSGRLLGRRGGGGGCFAGGCGRMLFPLLG